ncbi:MAG TPA: hypothetical protein VJ869_13410 [Sphaerochaeta sp.]|nr:hypothetical protein [Sphaerochaeta sp.]
MVIQYEGSYSFQMQEMLTSLSQDSVAEFVIAFLKRHQIRYKLNAHEIYYFGHPDQPLISCSLDKVDNLEEMNLLYQLEWANNPLSYIGHTATEENELGVFLLLKMLQKYPGLNFVFRRNERAIRDLEEMFIKDAVLLV